MFGRKLDVDRELVRYLGLPRAELTVHLGDGLRLDAAAEQVVDLVDAPGELPDLLTAFEHRRPGFETTDVGRFAGSLMMSAADDSPMSAVFDSSPGLATAMDW